VSFDESCLWISVILLALFIGALFYDG